jgi:hypothetical protein
MLGSRLESIRPQTDTKRRRGFGLTRTQKDPFEKLNGEQQARYKRIKAAQDRVRLARETAEERARQMVKDELRDLEAVRDTEVREAHALYEEWRLEGKGMLRGLATADIKRAMRTKDYDTVASIWKGLDLSLYQTPAEVPSFVIDYEAMTGVLNWFDWQGERTEGKIEFVLTVEEEEWMGMRYVPSYESKKGVSDLMDALEANEAYLALCREVDAAARKHFGR